MRRMLIPAMVWTCGIAGCARTVSPEEFLHVFRRGAAPMYTRDGYKAQYGGSDMLYHYLEVRYSMLGKNDASLLVHGGFRDETLRCLKSELPEAFPTDFERLYQWRLPGDEGSGESEADSREYVRRYLERYGKYDSRDRPPSWGPR